MFILTVFSDSDWKNLQDIFQSVSYIAENATKNFDINVVMSKQIVINPDVKIVNGILGRYIRT